MSNIMKKFILILLAVVLLAGCSSGAGNGDVEPAEEETEGLEVDSDITSAELPGMMDWVAYQMGTTGYAQAAGIANAITKATGTQIRIVPNDTSVGRIMSIQSEQSKYGFLADELYFANNAIYDFAEKRFGPQNLRVILAKPSFFGWAVTKKSGIKTVEELKGKRISYVPGNTSHIVKAEAYLAFAELTWDDVEIVNMASWSAGAKGLIEGKIDAIASQPTASTLYEVEASPVGLEYIEMPASNVEGWKRVQEICPWLAPGVESRGAGMEGKEYELPTYSYPQISCKASLSEDEAYNMIKALDESFDLYKDMDPSAGDWIIENSSGFPAGAPYHEGAIKYLEEKGLWTEEHEEWNNEQLRLLDEVNQAWDLVINEVEEKGIDDKEFKEYWLERRIELLGIKNR